MTPDTLKAWRARLSLGEAGMAAYLGVPVTTYRKWENGTRKPDAAPLRLFAVLQLLETVHKSTHLTLMSEAMTVENRPVKARKPRAATQVPPTPAAPAVGPDSHVLGTVPAGTVVTHGLLGQMIKANPPPGVHAAQALPDWMKSGA